MIEYTLKELAKRAGLRTRRAELLMQTMDLAARGCPEDYDRIAKLDIEIDSITSELEECF